LLVGGVNSCLLITHYIDTHKPTKPFNKDLLLWLSEKLSILLPLYTQPLRA
jgi:hypothetical protein